MLSFVWSMINAVARRNTDYYTTGHYANSLKQLVILIKMLLGTVTVYKSISLGNGHQNLKYNFLHVRLLHWLKLLYTSNR